MVLGGIRLCAVLACALFPSAAFAAPGSDATIVASGLQLNPGSSGGNLFACGAGRALGGGMSTQPDAVPLADMQLNAPLGPSASTATTATGDVPAFWQTSALNDATFVFSYTAYAVCSSTSDATIVAGAPVSLAASQAADFVAGCPTGRALGGGVSTTAQDPGSQIQVTAPLDEGGTMVGTVDGDVPRFWYTNVRNGPDGPRDYRGFAVCSPASDAVVEVQDVSVDNGDVGGATAVCPQGRRAVSGGISLFVNPVGSDLRSTHPVDETLGIAGTQTGDIARGWRADIVNVAATQTYRVAAVCVTDPPAPTLLAKKLQTKKKKKRCKKKGKGKRKGCKKKGKKKR
jgi:hypothetical protein